VQDFWRDHSYWALEKIASPELPESTEYFLVDNTKAGMARDATKVRLPAELCAGGSPELLDPWLWAKCHIRRGVCKRDVSQLLDELKVDVEGRFERPLHLKECDGGPETPKKKKGKAAPESTEKPEQPGTSETSVKSVKTSQGSPAKTPRRKRTGRKVSSPGSPSASQTPRRKRLNVDAASNGNRSSKKQKPPPETDDEPQDDEVPAQLEDEEEDEEAPPEGGNGSLQF